MRLLLAIWLLPAAAAAAPSPLYDRYCLACHGASGDGKGPAAPWLAPPPRDFTAGRYKWRSTPTGKPPTDADLARAIRAGAGGTAMPAFGGILDEPQIAALVDEIKAFAPARFREAATPVTVPPAPAALADGAALFGSLGCSKCHARELHLRRGRTAGDVVMTLLTGLDGTNMPAFPSLTPPQLYALAAHVLTIASDEGLAVPQDVSSTPGLHLAPQGPPPPSLPPAAASLSADQCARCHARQHAEWRRSLHARAMSPGVSGQIPPLPDGDCLPCHAPLAEQRADVDLRAEGVSCAGCHLRAHTRHGPPPPQSGRLLPIQSYPFTVDAAYERGDFCLPCHEAGPFLDTYREWATGPYLPRGVQCQHCHMPEREHSWKGIHDPETVRQGLRVTARRAGAAVVARAENAGAGHRLPTTPTPAITLSIEPEGGAPSKALRIGKHITFDGKRFHELEDTRLAPGASVELSLVTGRARVRVTVAPDDYYETFYAQLLARPGVDPRKRRELEAALKRAASSRYLLYDLLVE